MFLKLPFLSLLVTAKSRINGKTLQIIKILKIVNVDNNAKFRYQDDYSFGLMETSICWAALSRRSSYSEVGPVAA